MQGDYRLEWHGVIAKVRAQLRCNYTGIGSSESGLAKLGADLGRTREAVIRLCRLIKASCCSLIECGESNSVTRGALGRQTKANSADQERW